MVRKVKYTRITLKSLVSEARSNGIYVSFTTDMDGQYVITHKVITNNNSLMVREDLYHPDTCAMAHWLIKGMIAQSASTRLFPPVNQQ